MLKSIQLENFKVHRDTKIDLGNLTILCGANGSGKSSVIQSFLLLKQSPRGVFGNYNLNGALCELGKAKDVLYQFSDEDHLRINIESVGSYRDRSNPFRVDLVAEDLERDYLSQYPRPEVVSVRAVESDRPHTIFDPLSTQPIDVIDHLHTYRYFQFLSSRRDFRFTSSDVLVQHYQLSSEDGRGDLTAQFLEKYGKRIKVEPLLRHPKASDEFLINQITAWEQEVSHGVNVKPIQSGNAFDIKYSFNTPSGQTLDFDKRNVGYGLSYSLPVFTAILSAEQGALLLIENPDDHLHPAAAHKMSELICRAAAAGIQIIIETHNDHIINGTLVQVKKENIKPDQIRIWQFERDEDTQAAKAIEVKIHEGGRITYPPSGFFDQIRKDMKAVVGF